MSKPVSALQGEDDAELMATLLCQGPRALRGL
jgi:hypothetical protein